jgi:hypothetical protein
MCHTYALSFFEWIAASQLSYMKQTWLYQNSHHLKICLKNKTKLIYSLFEITNFLYTYWYFKIVLCIMHTA